MFERVLNTPELFSFSISPPTLNANIFDDDIGIIRKMQLFSEALKNGFHEFLENFLQKHSSESVL